MYNGTYYSTPTYTTGAYTTGEASTYYPGYPMYSYPPSAAPAPAGKPKAKAKPRAKPAAPAAPPAPKIDYIAEPALSTWNIVAKSKDPEIARRANERLAYHYQGVTTTDPKTLLKDAIRFLGGMSDHTTDPRFEGRYRIKTRFCEPDPVMIPLPPRPQPTPKPKAAPKPKPAAAAPTNYPPYGAYPATSYPTVSYPNTTYPSTTYPGTTYPGTTYPGTTYPSTTYPGTTYPGTTYSSGAYPATYLGSSAFPTTTLPGANSYYSTPMVTSAPATISLSQPTAASMNTLPPVSYYSSYPGQPVTTSFSSPFGTYSNTFAAQPVAVPGAPQQ